MGAALLLQPEKAKCVSAIVKLQTSLIFMKYMTRINMNSITSLFMS